MSPQNIYKKNSKPRFDIICAGGGLASYLTGALLSKNGKSVLLIDEETDEGMRKNEGQLFDPDFLPFPIRSGFAGPLESILRELGFNPEDEFNTYPTVTQVLSPRYRIALSTDRDRSLQEIRREIEGESEQVVDFFNRLYEAGNHAPEFLENVFTLSQSNKPEFHAWRRFWGPYYKSIHRNQPLRVNEVLNAHQVLESSQECEFLGAALLGGLSFAAPMNLGFEQVARTLPVFLQGQSFFRGGYMSLKKRLADVIRACGGVVRTNTHMEALAVENQKIIGVVLDSYEGVCTADSIILFSRIRNLYATLPERMKDPSVVRAVDRVVPTHWRFTVSVTVDPEVVPIGVTPHMVYVGSSKYPLEEDNFLRIQTLGNEGMILVTALVPYKASCLDYGYLRRLSGKMLQALSTIFPFVEEHIQKIYPDFRENEESIRAVYQFDGPDWVPEKLLQFYVRGHHLVQDFWGPSLTTPHPNLYFGGRSIWPALGSYGEVVTARKIINDLKGTA